MWHLELPEMKADVVVVALLTFLLKLSRPQRAWALGTSYFNVAAHVARNLVCSSDAPVQRATERVQKSA